MKSIYLDCVQYVEIDTHPGMFISRDGKVVSQKRVGPTPKSGISNRIPKDIRCNTDQDGYLYICRPKRFIHEIMTTTFHRPRNQGEQVRHLNGIKTDNRIVNLCWGTAEQNGNDKRIHGSAKGSKNSQAKLTEAMVSELRRQALNKPLSVLVQEYKPFSKFAIWAAISGYTWSHIPGAISKNRTCSKDSWKSGAKLRA